MLSGFFFFKLLKIFCIFGKVDLVILEVTIVAYPCLLSANAEVERRGCLERQGGT